MKKKILRIVSMLLLVVVAGALLAGCALFNFVEYDPDEGYDEEVVEENFDFVVTCSKETTTIKLHNIGPYGDVAQLVYLKPYEYLYGEAETGIVEEANATPTVVATYECGTEATFTISRHTEAERTNPNDYDTVYCKFYVVGNNKAIIAGPIYPTEIEPMLTHDEVIQTKGIKGIFTDWGQEQEIINLGVEHTETNLLATAMIVPLETYDEETGEITPINYEEHLNGDGKGYIINLDATTSGDRRPQYVEAYWHNGTKYYFRTADWNGYFCNLNFYDNLISWYTRYHVKTTLIVLVQLEQNQYILPYFLTYPTARKNANYGAVNTSNKYGAEYWAAFMEFLSYRYAQEETWEDAEFGTVETYVMGNEIDQSNSWNSLIDPNKHTMLEVGPYTVEHERMLRITNASFKSVYARNTALVSFTQWWNSSGGIYDYHPKDIFDYLSAKTKREGNYEWGLVAHPHGYCSGSDGFWNKDIASGVTGALNTPRITWTNLEVLQLYLEQPTKLCFGKVRDVYLTEGGISSNSRAEQTSYTDHQQAAGIAYAYYKATQLSCIKAMNYYRLQDHPLEVTWGDYFFGLRTTTGVAKSAYYVYKFIDTQYTFEVSKPYLQYITWTKSENGSLVPYGEKMGNVFTYQDTMPLLVSLFDWSTHWDESKIIVRETDQRP